MDWEVYEPQVQPRKEKCFSKNGWTIVWHEETKSGYISKSGRNSIVESFSIDKGHLIKGLGIPNYVVDKVNELLEEKQLPLK